MSTFSEIRDILYELLHSFSYIKQYMFELIISLDESGVLPEVVATRSTLYLGRNHHYHHHHHHHHTIIAILERWKQASSEFLRR